MKKLLWSSAVILLILVGCRDSPENQDDEQPTDTEETTEHLEDVLAAAVTGAMVPLSFFYEDPVFWQEVDEKNII